MTDQAELLPGTLDLLILKAVSLGPLHGYGILLRIGQISRQALLIEQGALYPALFRLVRQGLLKARGAHPITTGAPSFMNSRPREENACARKPMGGIAWSRPLLRPWPQNRSQYETHGPAGAPPSICSTLQLA